ncbi:hypothetical protein FRC00_012350, partial [Tulasnella sp. 408]
MQAAMPQKDMATATSTFGLMRQIGGTVGISASGSVYVSFLRRRLDDIQGYDASQIANSELINSVRSLKNIQPDSVRVQVVAAYAKSFFVRGYTLKRGVVREQKKGGATAMEVNGAPHDHDRDLERAAESGEVTPITGVEGEQTPDESGPVSSSIGVAGKEADNPSRGAQ